MEGGEKMGRMELFEYVIKHAEIRRLGGEIELWCSIVNDPVYFDDWFVFSIEELEKINVEDIVKNTEKYKVVGQIDSWAEIRKRT